MAFRLDFRGQAMNADSCAAGLAVTGGAARNGRGLGQPAGEIARSDDSVMTIGEVAQEFGITLRTLRFCESRRLVTPLRNGATDRRSA